MRAFVSVMVATMVVIAVGVGVLGGTNKLALPGGTVNGTLVLPLGPLVAAVSSEGTGSVGVVRVDNGAETVATVEVGTNLRFSVQLPPGSYRLKGKLLASFPWTCFSSQLVKVVANATLSVKLDCPTFTPRSSGSQLGG